MFIINTIFLSFFMKLYKTKQKWIKFLSYTN